MTFEEKQQKLEKLLVVYQNYFDILRDVSIDGVTFPATAEFHSRSEKYVLVKAAQIWATESNEYAYFYIADKLGADELDKVYQTARDAGLKLVKPHSEHMYSYVTLVILADEIDKDVKEAIKKIRFEKSFRLSLHGWMEFRIAAINLSNGEIITNRKGKDVRAILEQNLQSK